MSLVGKSERNLGDMRITPPNSTSRMTSWMYYCVDTVGDAMSVVARSVWYGVTYCCAPFCYLACFLFTYVFLLCIDWLSWLEYV